MKTSFFQWATAVLAASAVGVASAQVTVFDGTANLVTIPSVSVGAATYTNVTLRHLGNLVFTLMDATEQTPAGQGVASYDAASGRLTIPAVQVGTETYVEVTLRDAGGFVFTVEAATLLPQATIDDIKAFLATYDAQWATAVPATGALTYAMNDACYLGGGRSRDWLVADFDLDTAAARAERAYRVGSTRTNLQVLAWRETTLADGSRRREVDIQYDVAYLDGSVAVGATETLVSGSSAGTPGCGTAQTGSGWRFYGDQRLIGFSLQARMLRDERYSIATGAPLSPSVRYRRDMRVFVTDPLGKATYVVVSGPGPATTINGVPVPWSWKMISPRLMRSAPELAGKPGSYVNWQDEDAFRYCGIAGSGTPAAAFSDCVTHGAPGDNWGIGYTATPDAAADQSFEAQGWRVGGAYRVDVYNDDGWRTVNGHAGRTPIATYYETLKSLPRRFVEMAGTGPSPTANDQFARLRLGALGATGVRINAMSATPAPINVSWNLQPGLSVTQPFRLQQGWEYAEAPKIGLASGATWPRLRLLSRIYPGPTATSYGSWPVAPLATGMASRSYFEYTLYHTDRMQSVVQSRVSYQ